MILETGKIGNLNSARLSCDKGRVENVSENPYIVTNFMETKAILYPIENISDSENMY